MGNFLTASKYCEITFIGKNSPKNIKNPPFWHVHIQKVPFWSIFNKCNLLILPIRMCHENFTGIRGNLFFDYFAVAPLL
jgi:hypothetical protein